MIWARFAKPGRGTFRVVGVHTAAPHYPTIHVQHMRWLAEHLSSGERLIIGGDFNATPWSTRLMRMAAQHNLQRAMTFSWSWPSIIYPLLLIDNFYVSNLLQIRYSKIGPDVGSSSRYVDRIPFLGCPCPWAVLPVSRPTWSDPGDAPNLASLISTPGNDQEPVDHGLV